MITLARVNHGRWIADCPDCPDARLVTPGQTSMVCAAGHPSTVQWPPADLVIAITDALARRPAEKNRNWYPGGHPLAVANGEPMDQTPAELDAETAAHADAYAEERDKRRQLLAMLADLGISVGPDGTISGKV